MSKLNLTVIFPEERQMNVFLNMLAWMELCGNVGHCTDFVVKLDGDGSARPKFIFNDESLQNSYDELRKQYLDDLKTMPHIKNVGSVDIGFYID